MPTLCSGDGSPTSMMRFPCLTSPSIMTPWASAIAVPIALYDYASSRMRSLNGGIAKGWFAIPRTVALCWLFQE